MTLFRQLFVAISLLFFALIVIIDMTYVDNSKSYLQNQLTAHSQDVATVLGMVLPLTMESGDKVKIETMVNVVFDRGYYSSIRVVSTQGETIVLKEPSPMPPEVPRWFTEWVKLETPTAESLISNGWHQLGRVIVSSHPNFAYRQLWATTQATTYWLVATYLISLLLLHRFLKTILHPLRDIEIVAKAISDRDFRTVKNTPRTRELRSVVLAINLLSNKIRELIGKEVGLANRYREEAHQDGLTKLSNRRGFEIQLEAILDSSSNIESGVLYLIDFPNFAEFNSARGYAEGDRLLTSIGKALSSVEKNNDLLCARISGAIFAVVRFNLSQAQAETLGRELSEALLRAMTSEEVESMPIGCGGVFFGSEKISLDDLMAEADAAMLQSCQKDGRTPILSVHKLETDNAKKDYQYWTTFIESALEHGRTALFVQSVRSSDENNLVALQHEVTGRLYSEDGEIIPASLFIAAANRHHLVPHVDKNLLEKLFKLLPLRPELKGQIAINLAIHSVNDPDLVNWLVRALGDRPGLARRIVFEFVEFHFVHDLQVVREFIGKIRKVGANFAVDNFGLHQSAFEYLQNLRPAYIKLNASFTADIEQSKEKQFFISSVVNLTRSLGIIAIAVNVETGSQLRVLRNLGVDGYQGYAIERPSRLD